MALDKEFRRLADRKYLLTILLIAFIVFGLACKLFLALNNDLNSDSVGPGILSMEALKNGNLFLSGYNFPVNCPYIFTDLIPFQLVPQLLTNYDPVALSIVGFVIYVLILAVYSLIVARVSGDRLKALLFAALFGNLMPSAYLSFIQPFSHGATILFSGVLLLFLLTVERLKLYHQILLAIVVFLITFSDSLALAIIAIPLAIVYFYMASRKNGITLTSVVPPLLVILAPALLAYALKLLMPQMVSMEVDLITTPSKYANVFDALIQNLSLYVHDLALALNDSSYSTLNGGFGILEIIGLAVVALFIYALKNVLGDIKKEERPLLIFLLVSNGLLFLGYVFTSLNASRYLMLTALSVFVVMGLGYNKKMLYMVLAVAIIAAGAYGCAQAVIHPDHHANSKEYGLIDYLESNDLTYGYANYWDANLITYLSKENVTVRAVIYGGGQLLPYNLSADSKWYDYRPTRFFLLYRADNPDSNIGAFASSNTYDNMTRYDGYYIFIYDQGRSPLAS